MVLFPGLLSAQDLHFSQFNETPALVNPALVGTGGPLKASLITKDQWRSVAKSYRTYGANVELKQEAENVREKAINGISAGISVYSDKSAGGMLSVNRVNLSLASLLALNKFHFISVGLQGSLVQTRVNPGDLVFPDQYNGSIYDPNQASKENFASRQYSYFDAAAGAVWRFRHDEQKFESGKHFSSNLGFSVFHITQPKDRFLISNNSSDFKYVLHGDLTKSLGSSRVALSPSFLIQMRGPSAEILAGTLVRHYFKGNAKYTALNLGSCFAYGAYYRSGDAVILSSLFELSSSYSFIFGYEINVSRLKTASYMRGGFEFGIRYNSPPSSFYKK